MFKKAVDENNPPAAFVNGFTDGQAARGRNASLTAYLRVGIDEYAKGFRAGFYARAPQTTTAERPVARQVVNL
jgi:hypothetical protein